METQELHVNTLSDMNIKSLDFEFRHAKALPPTDAKLIQVITDSVIRQCPDAKIEWDEGAGDTWVMVNRNDANLAMLNSTIPLLFAKSETASYLSLEPDRVVMVIEDDFTLCHFSIDPRTVLETLNLVWPIEQVDPNQFSLADLSWATI